MRGMVQACLVFSLSCSGEMNTMLTWCSETSRCRTNFRALELLKLSWLVLNHGGPRRHNEVETSSGMIKEWWLTRVSSKVH